MPDLTDMTGISFLSYSSDFSSDVMSDHDREIHNHSLREQANRDSHIDRLKRLRKRPIAETVNAIDAAFKAEDWQKLKSLVLGMQKPYKNKPKNTHLGKPKKPRR